jgi:hypothetical protein
MTDNMDEKRLHQSVKALFIHIISCGSEVLPRFVRIDR